MSKTKTTKKFKLNPIAVIAVVLSALVAIYCVTTAWLTSGTPLNPLRLMNLQDFQYTVYVYDSQNGGEWVEQTEPLTFDADEINTLPNYRFKIVQQGSGVAFTRVRISQEWKLADGSRLQGEYNMPFKVAENKELFDNRLTDGYVYYMGAFPVGGDGVEIFSGFDSANFDTSALTAYGDITLSIDVTVDAVQFNRYQQLWGMDSLPWR